MHKASVPKIQRICRRSDSVAMLDEFEVDLVDLEVEYRVE